MKNKKEIEARLKDLREEIDKIDRTILDCLKRRYAVVKEVGELKRALGVKVLDLSRERAVINKILEENQGEFPEKSLKAIFLEIVHTCRTAQELQKVAYLGPEATFSHMAALKFFGRAANFLPQESVLDVFEETEAERAKFGVVPVENSIEGTVSATLDAFSDYKVKVCGEVFIPITHDLLNQSGRKEDIKKVLSHPHALAQCRKWLRKNLPSVPVEEVSSTAFAARWAAVDPSVAAIASPLAARTYHLQVVASRIEDFHGNVTRFWVIGKENPGPTGKDKTSLFFSISDRPGALFEVLSSFAKRQINLSKIESRPAKKEPWRYHFFLDCEGHIEDGKVKECIDEISRICMHLEWLGSYPAGEEE
ncbi:prephenate dehydratase [Thermodesulfatator autotrophicus]|uniref:Bifunctional chorismate mutase/prephenate dehydratase n=1 Tax=Thermodesulfatator autotrophicus TaxID=1795632 RepID=A0A177E8Q6_9BACT|nr:prephenate dehydratase [Thermodesulfatator autotrophicus]OAG27871.1 prephenate dehydratase [Thermodesulfatator autotrophicus]